MSSKLQNLVKGPVGVMEFEAKFQGMRKSQDWIIYKPVEKSVAGLTIQSDKRIGRICLETGRVALSAAIAGGARFVDLPSIKQVDILDAADLSQLKQLFQGGGELGPTRIG